MKSRRTMHIGTLMALARATVDVGDQSRTRDLLARVMRIASVRGQAAHFSGPVLDVLATGAAGDAGRAALLWGAAGTARSASAPRLPRDELDAAPYRARACEQLGDAAFEAAYAEGCKLPAWQTIDLELAGVPFEVAGQ